MVANNISIGKFEYFDYFLNETYVISILTEHLAKILFILNCSH